jgi:hypothetical protein
VVGTRTRKLIRSLRSDGTIISADSLGQVTFWDGKSLAQIKSFKAHAADALCLVISPVSAVGKRLPTVGEVLMISASLSGRESGLHVWT